MRGLGLSLLLVCASWRAAAFPMDPAAEAPGLRTPEGAARQRQRRAAGSDDAEESTGPTPAPGPTSKASQLARQWSALKEQCGGHSGWPTPLLLTPSARPPTRASSPAFGFLHLRKGGGSTQKVLIKEMSLVLHWPHTGAGTIASHVEFWNSSSAHQFRLLWGHFTLGQIAHTHRPSLYWTSLREPTARTISQFNQLCCGVVEGVAHPGQCETLTLEQAMRDEATSTFEVLLGLRTLALETCVRANASLADDITAALFDLATMQLHQPCVSMLLLSRVESDVVLLNRRWSALDFALPTHVPHANALQRGGKNGSETCHDPRLVDPHDPAVVARVERAAAADPFGRLARRLFRWAEEHVDELWARPLALCEQ